VFFAVSIFCSIKAEMKVRTGIKVSGEEEECLVVKWISTGDAAYVLLGVKFAPMEFSYNFYSVFFKTRTSCDNSVSSSCLF